MTKTTKRVPNSKGFESIFPKIKKEPKATKIIKEPRVVLPNTVELSAPPKNYIFCQHSIKKVAGDITLANMSWDGYPLCCGAANMFGFTYITDRKKQVKTIESAIRQAEEAQKGMVTCITNDNQENMYGWGKSLTDCGFIPVFKSSNPNHMDQTVITLWCLNLGCKDFSKEYNKIENTSIGSGSKRSAA